MKIAHLLSGIGIVLTNEERKFIDRYNTNISINGLDEHSKWVAQNLLRKGVYSISNDRRTLLKKINETNS